MKLSRCSKGLIKLSKNIFYPNFGYLVITFEPKAVESQSKAQKTRILA